MSQISLEGENLGKRHRHYNNLIKQAIDKNEVVLSPINYNDSDIVNFMKIDVASNKKDVDFILQVIQCNDLLYVSRAIKKATWLITDDQYAHIINPDYLFSNLFSTMTSKASNKLILQIRLKLKSEKRVEDFYNYLQDKDFNSACKWLPGCSIEFLKDVLTKKALDMKMEIHLLLSKKSFELLKVAVASLDYRKRRLLEENMYYLETHTDEFLNLVETLDECDYPKFGSKATKLIVTKCPERINKNLQKYLYNIDLDTFAKNMKKEDIKPFVSQLFKDEKFENFTKFEKLKPFINRIPTEGRFEFVTKIFGNRNESSNIQPLCKSVAYSCSSMENDYIGGNSGGSTFANIYRYYIYAPFDKAFAELNKLIRSESSPTERNAMLLILITCAKKTEANIRTLLEYYLKKHVNAPPNLKRHFVNNIISKTNVHTYDASTWKILNEIFYSLGVYNLNDKDTNSLQTCIQTIIVYMVLHKQTVPEVIQNKLSFESLKNIQNKLNNDEKEIMFKYLFDLMKSNIEKQNITSETQFNKVSKDVENMLNFVKDFNKDIKECPFVLDKIKQLLEIKLKNSWEVNISYLYNVKKSWRKHLFEESLILHPTEDSCLNALKHDPELLSRYSKEVKGICNNDSVALTKVLRKIRTYWPLSLATEWSAAYLGKIHESATGTYKSVIKGLCVLLPQNQLLDVIKKHAPKEDKITWSDEDEVQLAIRKQLARSMYLARPLLPPDCILWYAKGDYLQFALPSFHSIFYNLSPQESTQHIPNLLKAPVSLQKHGIRLAFKKQKSENLPVILAKMWSETKNATIRMELFKETFKLICSEKNPTILNNLWKVLSSLIDSLTADENKQIYETLGKTADMPLQIRPEYTVKSYKFLKSLPAQANCESIIRNVIESTIDIMDILDIDFMSDIIFDDFENKITKRSFSESEIIANYLLRVKDESAQLERYEKILVPLLDKILAKWDYHEDLEGYVVRLNLNNLLNVICENFEKHVCALQLTNPIELFSKMCTKLENSVPLVENYIMLRKLKLALAFAKAVNVHKDMLANLPKETVVPKHWWSDAKYHELYFKASFDFAQFMFTLIKDDVENLYPSIHFLFKNALRKTIESFRLHSNVKLSICKEFLELSKDFIPGLLVVIEMLPEHYSYKDDKDKELLKTITTALIAHPSQESESSRILLLALESWIFKFISNIERYI